MEEKQMIKKTKYGWVDLSNVPKKGKLFDWKGSVGAIIKFEYFDTEYTMNIIQYIDCNHILVNVNSYNTVNMSTSDIIAGKFGKPLGKRVYDFRYCVGDIVNNTLLITSAYKDGIRKCYSYKCLLDGYEGSILEINLHRGIGCPVCVNKKVMPGVNDIATTHPEIAALFWDMEDATKYTVSSGRKVDFKCPRCGNKINSAICRVTTRYLHCRKCGDSFSYPEKFVYNFLQQVCEIHHENRLLCDFELQKTFEWSKNIQHSNSKLSGSKRYDFYIPLQREIIIETHGNQHFEQCLFGSGKSSKTLQEELENDKIKHSLAVQNGVDCERYIVLDCRQSTVTFIKHSIMSSDLPSLLGFKEEDIDWDACNAFATSSRVYEACLLWNNGMHMLDDIAYIMKLHKNTIRRYLRRGEELGIVQDPPKRRKTLFNK